MNVCVMAIAIMNAARARGGAKAKIVRDDVRNAATRLI